jgi:signal transduction histidine kinase
VNVAAPTRAQRWHAARRRMRHSIRARLVLLFMALALAIGSVFLFGMSRMLKSGWQAWARPLVADYVDHLAADLGSPPELARAQALVARLPVTLRIDGPQLHYDSHPKPPGARGFDRDSTAENWGLVRTTADGHRVRFGLAQPAEPDRPRVLGWITLAVLLLLTLLAWAVTRKLLQPLAVIGDGVSRYARADFSQPITVRHRDELGDLADRVNGMARSLQGMLEDKRALLLAISHELRSPLTRARLNAELVDDGAHKDALLRDLAEMRDLISALLEGERIAAGAPALQLAPVDLAALVHEVADAAGDPPPLTFDLSQELAPVSADATRLKLLLRNLVDNARRHGADAAQPPQVFLRREADGRLALGVRDFGPGVPDNQIQRLSEAFYRPDSARTRAAGGVGLGLYLCRLVAQAHGGELRITNAQPGLQVAMVWVPAR